MEVTLPEAAILVRAARGVVTDMLNGVELPWEKYFKELSKYDKFKVKRGVFTSIYQFPSHELRGCIGFPYPDLELYKAVVFSALRAAFEDPRFPPLEKDELDEVVFELSILSPPEKLRVSSPLEYPKKIVVGKHGLILRYRDSSALLLPQVPLEYGWDSIEFLNHLAMKAGYTPDIWLDPAAEIYVFTAEVYIEKKPNGEVVRREI